LTFLLIFVIIIPFNAQYTRTQEMREMGQETPASVPQQPLLITWEPNQRAEGVMSRHPSGIIIFPSKVGAKPIEGPGRTRSCLPQAGETELCILRLAPDGNVYFAYPHSYQIKGNHGHYFVLSEQDEVVATVVPAEDHAGIEAYLNSDGTVVIEINPPQQ